MKQKILVVDDEIAICDLLKITLEGEGYEVKTSHNGRDALSIINSFKPNLLILDLMLPEINGFDICRRVTSQNPIPIIMLTAKTDLVDKVLGLELGADDYITKPFHVRELVARVKALLRRVSIDRQANLPKTLTNGCLELDADKRKVWISGQELELSVKEFDLIFFFMSHIDRVFSRETLLEKVWGYDFAGDTRTVDVHIQRLRKKLGDGPSSSRFIQTVFGVGYRMLQLEQN